MWRRLFCKKQRRELTSFRKAEVTRKGSTGESSSSFEALMVTSRDAMTLERPVVVHEASVSQNSMCKDNVMHALVTYR